MTTTVQLKNTHEPNRGSQIMNDEPADWANDFQALFENKVAVYKSGIQKVEAMFSQEEKDFLRSIGATPQEIFDFVEDWADDGVPDPETVLALTKIRRDYFLQAQQGKFPEKLKNEEDFPSRSASLASLDWFPRIIEKARAKLRGELPTDLMYSCGGDRRFLNKVKISPVEFLETVREAGDNDDHIIKFVTDRSKT